MNVRLPPSQQHSPISLTNDPATAVLLERQGNITHQLNRIEHKIDQIPKNGAAKKSNGNGRTGGIQIAGAWFSDWKSLAMWILIAGMLAGHVTREQVTAWLMEKL